LRGQTSDSSLVTPQLSLESLPDECAPVAGVHPPEGWLLVYQLHRCQPDQHRLTCNLAPGHGLNTALLAAAFRFVQFVAEPATRDDAEPDTFVRVWVVILHGSASCSDSLQSGWLDVSDVLEIDTSDPEEWPTDPEEWPRDLLVQDVDSGSEAVFRRVLTTEEVNDE